METENIFFLAEVGGFLIALFMVLLPILIIILY